MAREVRSARRATANEGKTPALSDAQAKLLSPFAFPVQYQLAIPDDSGGYNPGIEIGTGTVAPGGSIPIPNDPSLCGREVRLVVFSLNPPLVVGPIFVKLTCGDGD